MSGNCSKCGQPTGLDRLYRLINDLQAALQEAEDRCRLGLKKMPNTDTTSDLGLSRHHVTEAKGAVSSAIYWLKQIMARIGPERPHPQLPQDTTH